MEKERLKEIEARNKKTVIVVFSAVALMIGVAYASVPLYNLFCKVTGYNGTTSRADSSSVILDRDVNIHFRSTTAHDMPWRFEAETPAIKIKVGEESLINFIAENPTDKPVTGTAIYNVTPLKVGKYFKKIQCFCFDEQTLNPEQRVNMPVLFFIDPEIAQDPNLNDVKTITLSYTFYRKDSVALETAVENY